MAVILPKVDQRPEYGFLSGLGTGLAHGITQAAESKLAEFQRRRQAESGRESLRKVGLPESVIDIVQQLPPQQQLEYALAYHQGQQEEPQQQQFGLEAFSGMGQQQRPRATEQNQLQDILGALGGAQQAPQGLEQFLSPEQRKSLRYQQSFGSPQEQVQAEELPLAPAQRQAPQEISKQPVKRTDKQAEDFFKAVTKSRGQLKPADIAKLNAQERKETLKEQERADKETKKYYTEVKGAAKAAKNSNIRLNRMEELIKKENLSFPLTSSLVKAATKGVFGLGLDLSSILTADTQEFDKLSTDFLKDAKAIFGSRITDVDLQNFLKTVPTSTMSAEGKKRVIRDLKIFNEAALAEDKAVTEIIRENGGRRPANLEELVEERTGKKLDKLADKFKSGL